MIFLIPTDTCYGLAGDITEQDYLDIYRLKGRDFSKQLAIIVEDFDDMKQYIDISDEQIEFLRTYPYPWSFLGKRRSEYILPSWMDMERYLMLSLRVAKVCLKNLPPEKGEGEGVSQKGTPNNITPPNLPLSREEGNQVQFPLFLTSANLSGQPESTTLAQAQAYFPGIDGLDGGVCDRPPSDIFSIGEDGELQYVRRNYGS